MPRTLSPAPSAESGPDTRAGNDVNGAHCSVGATPAGFERVDVSLAAWPQLDRKDVVAFWQATMPALEQKKKLFVDDEVLCELFERLKDTSEPPKLNFRFVLGLILMRKKMLVYENSRTEDGKDIWVVRF